MARSSVARLLAAAVLLVPASFVAGALRPDQQPSFMGWYLAPDSTEAINCATDQVWTTTSADRLYAGCCQSGQSCNIATDCYGTSVLYGNNSTELCTSGNYCMSFTIFQSFPDGDPSAVQLWCNTYWRANTIYRELATTSPAAVPTPATVTVTASPASSPTSDGPAETGASAPDTAGDGKKGNSAGESKAWVAGAVLGSIAAVGFIGLAFWYGRRRALQNRGDGGGAPIGATGAAVPGDAGSAAGPGPGPGRHMMNYPQPNMSFYQDQMPHGAGGPPSSAAAAAVGGGANAAAFSSYHVQPSAAGANSFASSHPQNFPPESPFSGSGGSISPLNTWGQPAAAYQMNADIGGSSALPPQQAVGPVGRHDTGTSAALYSVNGDAAQTPSSGYPSAASPMGGRYNYTPSQQSHDPNTWLGGNPS